MKILLVGAARQGKLDYARRVYSLSQQAADGKAMPWPGSASIKEVYNLHQLVRRLMEQGYSPQAALLPLLEAQQDWLVICDEVGSGVVPVDPFERHWREAVGRLCCALAERADIVERITCGLPQRLKGTEA